jgi:hypothetical protein
MPATTDTNGAARASDARAATPLSIARPRIIKPIPIQLDRERHLVMDFTAMEAFEAETGLSAWSREAWDGRPRHIGLLLWAALLHEDPELTFDVIRPYLTMANLSYLTERLGELWGETMPEADATTAEAEGDADPNPRRRAG